MDIGAMITTRIEITKITPSEGMVLTNGETYALNGVHVGKNDSIDNWYEITIEEYEKIVAKREADDEDIH